MKKNALFLIFYFFSGVSFASSLEAFESQARHFLIQKKRGEWLKSWSKRVALEKGRRRALSIERMRVVGCTFLTEVSAQLYQEGLAFFLNQNYRSAIEKFKKVLAEEPEHLEVLTRMGQAFLLEGRFSLARETLMASYQLNPYEVSIQLWLGRCLHKLGDLRALVFLEASLVLQSEQAFVWYAEALFSFGKSQQALLLLMQDTKRYPFHLLSLMALAKIQMQSPASLWHARKTLQLTWSRLEEGFVAVLNPRDPFAYDPRPSREVFQRRLQLFLDQVQLQIVESSTKRSGSDVKSQPLIPESSYE